MPERRRFLAAAGLAAATAGCMDALGSDSANEAAPGSGGGDAEGVRVGRLSVRNNHDAGHRVQVAIAAAEGVVHMDTYEVSAGSGTVIEGDWNSTPDEYVVHARLDDGEIRTTDVTASVSEETGCVRMVLRIDDAGELGILFGQNCER